MLYFLRRKQDLDFIYITNKRTYYIYTQIYNNIFFEFNIFVESLQYAFQQFVLFRRTRSGSLE